LFPLFNPVREGELKWVSENEKEKGDVYYSTHHYFPLFKSVREGN